MPWYAIRHVYLFKAKPGKPNVFEERVVCFQAASWPEAHAKAEKEATEYAAGHKMVRHPLQVGYELDDEDAPLKDGAEVWSQLYDSDESLEEFHKNRYEKFHHRPE